MWAGSKTWKANWCIIYYGMPDYSLLWCQDNFLALLNFQENTSQEPTFGNMKFHLIYDKYR